MTRCRKCRTHLCNYDKYNLAETACLDVFLAGFGGSEGVLKRLANLRLITVMHLSQMSLTREEAHLCSLFYSYALKPLHTILSHTRKRQLRHFRMSPVTFCG